MDATLLDLAGRLVPISDFSQGKAGKIFNDVAKNNNEYIVLKNNQPTAVLMSVKEYRDTQEKVAKLEMLLEKIENIRLLKLAESRVDNKTSSFESFVNEQGFSIEELETLSESVELE
ncbi:MAG: type II toxin-antitoxin system Phd/YefM family antitoxin [Roseburia sp.]|nr:type II toxin-antitoxin system Phd/YefM family antitoxin [Ruminococcus sp.]MCM1153778.1 type II toxin-antitoxin system Phd/YefM family antitoxin [Roseburia sp.]MCM1243132.1 type II toxin-antitoxin system Phd/YefM family antitoxin [Roseburia sp.]